MNCGKPPEVCVCDKVVPLQTKHDILILQHPQEQDVVLGTVPLLLTSLPKAQKFVGLSWPAVPVKKNWAIMYPASLPRELTADEEKAPYVLIDKKGTPIDDVDGIILLDGTWSQAKALWWRNAWMLKQARLLVHPKEPSLYGKLRKEPRREYVSTLEACGAALTALGEDPNVEATLKRLFRTMLQRARDAKK